LEQRISELVADDELENNKGIYQYVLDGQEKHLSLRTFSNAQKLAAYERQKGICPLCNKHYELSHMHGDHIVPWSKGGKTVPENCHMLCTTDNIKKSNL
jgi:5-methylcytosine-specific restriction endonuclease McrA